MSLNRENITRTRSLSSEEFNIDPLEDSYMLCMYYDDDDDLTKIKKFLFKLIISLHKAGNLTFKTEEYVIKVARSYRVHCSLSITPRRVVVAFYMSKALSATNSESYTFRISSGLDCTMLEGLHMLCNDICSQTMDINVAMERLNLLHEKRPL